MSPRPRRRKERQANLRDLSAPVREVVLPVYRDRDGLRLDQFLAEHFPWRSKTAIQTWIREGRIRISQDGKAKKARRLRAGEEVRIAVDDPEEEPRHEAIARRLDILYEDDDLVAINKPPGLVVHPVGKTRVNTLIQALHWRYRHGPGRVAGRTIVPKICHRLDRDTSGVMVVAKSDPARRRLQELFEARSVKKTYRALLRGRTAFDETRVEAPIGSAANEAHGTLMGVRDDGLPALSDFRTLARFEAYSDCEVRIESGRQHQIRVHARHLGHPVLCDRLYSPSPRLLDPEGAPILARQALHAARLRLPRPYKEDQILDLSAPISADMKAVIAAGQQGHSLRDGHEEEP